MEDNKKHYLVYNADIKEIVAYLDFLLENTFKLDVPLKVDIEVGNNWYEAK